MKSELTDIPGSGNRLAVRYAGHGGQLPEGKQHRQDSGLQKTL